MLTFDLHPHVATIVSYLQMMIYNLAQLVSSKELYKPKNPYFTPIYFQLNRFDTSPTIVQLV